MDLHFSGHALDRMLEQGIDPEMVEAVLLNPTWTPFTMRRIRYDGVVGGRRLSVIVSAADESRVVTAFWYREELNA